MLFGDATAQVDPNVDYSKVFGKNAQVYESSF